jgi:hypothetical protein
MKSILHTTRQSITRPALRATGLGTRPSAPWNKIKLVAALVPFFGLGAGQALASDPVGVYALVDKVVFEPNDTSPQSIQIWGAFAIAQGRGDTYRDAQRGYLYYKVNPDKPDACRKEWKDLKSVAGTGQIVAFASRYGAKGTLRKKNAKAQNPDVYPVEMGLTKVTEKTDYTPIKQLLALRGSRSRGGASPNPGKKP